MARKRAPRKPRDPTWRMRRALGQKRKESAKVYRRQAARRTERAAGAEEEHDGSEES